MHRIVVRLLLIVLSASALTSRASSQPPTAERTLAERLGLPRDAKLLIVHGDDLGVSHSVDAASIKALDSGALSSASIMIPCPWLLEVAAYARSHSSADLGLHLTLTSEWTTYRWGPVSSTNRVPSLLNRDGYLHATGPEAAAAIAPAEAEVELRAQVERARAVGIQPTHLDSHMGTLFQNRALFDVYLRVARDYRLPALISKEFFDQAPFFRELVRPSDIVIDRIVSATPAVTAEGWREFYAKAIRELRPGVTEFIVHMGYDDAELRAVTFDHPEWGAAWRQRDFDFFTSDEFKRLLRENGVRLVTWRELGTLLEKPAN